MNDYISNREHLARSAHTVYQHYVKQVHAKATPTFIVPVIKPSILRIFWLPFLRGQILGRLQFHIV